MNLGNTCLFNKEFFTVNFGNKKKNAVNLPHSAQRKHASLVKTKEKAKSKNGHRERKLLCNYYTIYWDTISTRSLMAGYIKMFWKDIELIMDPKPFCTSCQIYSMNKKARFKTPLNPKSTFKWVFIDMIPATYPIFGK